MGAARWAFVALAACGVATIAVALVRSRRVAPDLGEFLEDLDYPDDQQRLLEPLLSRLLGGPTRAIASWLERLLPKNYLAGIQRQLAQAGLSGRRRAGEHVAIQLGLATLGAALVPLLPPVSPLLDTLALVLLPIMGFALPAVRLQRAIRTRSEAIFKDLPDVVDMMAIAVEAGSGFEAALSMVCKNFSSPLTDELSTALRAMELGLPRRQALQQLRDRVDIDSVRILMVAILQADALGIPISRVLKSQAAEVRARRRAWARERAAKLPVKIMFPLVLFIFPPVLALVLGPAVSSFSKLG